MQRIVLFLIVLLSLTGCIRKIPIEQGNILESEKVQQIHLGMTPAEIKEILGTPILLNTFRDDRIDYVYTYKPPRGQTTESRLTLIFQNNHLVKMDADIKPEVKQN